MYLNVIVDCVYLNVHTPKVSTSCMTPMTSSMPERTVYLNLDTPKVSTSCMTPMTYSMPERTAYERPRAKASANKECPFSGVTNSGSLEEGAGKRCSDCESAPSVT